MAQTIYKRQLIGQQSGVQVNMPRDTVERLLSELGNQSFSVVGQFTRGRIDKPFQVSSSKMQRYLGKPQSMRKNAANETYVQIFEAFANGAAAAVVSRVVSSNAVNKWIVVKKDPSTPIDVGETLDTGSDNWLFAVKIADCINDGVYATIIQEDADGYEYTVTIRERDADSLGKETGSGEQLYQFSGSLKVDALDDVGESYYIGDVAAKYYGDWVEIDVNENATPDKTTFKTAQSATVVNFVDGASPDASAYQKAAIALGNTPLQYRYIMGDSNNTALITTLLGVAQKYNRIMMQEISGSLTPNAAIAWKNTFNYNAQGGMHCLWIWSPIKRKDPTNASGVYQYGTVGQKIGYACARNSQTNGFGLAKMNQPIAGKDYYLSGESITQTYFPDDVELAELAKNHINPVLYAEYHDGSGFVWDDSLSGAKKNGISRLENAVEVSQWIQDKCGKYSRSLLQKPMTEAIRSMKRFLEDELQAMAASGWITASTQLGGSPYSYSVAPSDRNPEDEMQVTVNIAIDGVVRRIFVSQNMYSRS